MYISSKRNSYRKIGVFILVFSLYLCCLNAYATEESVENKEIKESFVDEEIIIEIDTVESNADLRNESIQIINKTESEEFIEEELSEIFDIVEGDEDIEELSEVLDTTESEMKSENDIENAETNQTESVEIYPEEIDLGDYETTMVVGDKQLLYVTVLPTTTTNQSIKFKSSDVNIASINGLGRITANKEGTCVITGSCGEIEESFKLTVCNSIEETVAVEDIDVGDCPTSITQGTSQLIYPLVIPSDATNQDFTFSTNNSNVVSVNALGRITGVSVGTAVITVSCGGKTKSFSIKVIENEETKKISVTDIEISAYREELSVGATMTVAATVIPDNATNSKITYKSSDGNIATVNSSGEIKGVSPGDVIIYVTADGCTKEMPIKVKVGTDIIRVNENYVALKVGNTFQIQASVEPEGANSTIKYKSLDNTVATVSDSGLVYAINNGNTVIVISNGELQVSLSVFVNESESIINEETIALQDSIEKDELYSDSIEVNEYSKITKDMLIYYYRNNSLVSIHGNNYCIYLEGKNIVNFENTLYTDINFEEVEAGYQFIINQEQKLCGKIQICFQEEYGKYLYLYNGQKGKYERLDMQSCKNINIDTEGKYLISEKIIRDNKVQVYYEIVGIIAIILVFTTILFYRKVYIY